MSRTQRTLQTVHWAVNCRDEMCHSRNEIRWCQCTTCCITANNYHAQPQIAHLFAENHPHLPKHRSHLPQQRLYEAQHHPRRPQNTKRTCTTLPTSFAHYRQSSLLFMSRQPVSSQYTGTAQPLRGTYLSLFRARSANIYALFILSDLL